MIKDKNNIQAIAFYLPQFHPIPENDKWWGKGFTEWTNVGKAKALFKGHDQPKVPADLGYYDLRLPESRIAQAELAKNYGIDGFCYYHYWFGDGRQLLERPFNEVLASGEPDFPFMLCWANESWHSKFWSDGGVYSKKLLIEQKYDDEAGHITHFMHLLKAFKDPRYIKIDEKPVFMIYRPLEFSNIKSFIKLWNQLAQENGLQGIYFIAQTQNIANEYDEILKLDFNAINVIRLSSGIRSLSTIKRGLLKLKRIVKPSPLKRDYAKDYLMLTGKEDYLKNVIPTVIPNWDHTPRSGNGGLVFINSNPNTFAKHLRQVFEILIKKENKIVFIKSWNEWGEGNYMEPDLKYGRGYLEQFKRVKCEFDNKI